MSLVNWILLFFAYHGRTRVQQKRFFLSSTRLASDGSIPNAARSPGSKNHVTRTHRALQPKQLQIVHMMMMTVAAHPKKNRPRVMAGLHMTCSVIAFRERPILRIRWCIRRILCTLWKKTTWSQDARCIRVHPRMITC